MTKTINQPITTLKGVGEKRAIALGELGIQTIYDLLTYYPFRYEDLSIKNITEIEDKEKTAVKGKVVAEPVLTHYGYRKSRLNFRLATEEKVVVPVTFFNQPYLKGKVRAGEETVVQGTWNAKTMSLTGAKILSSETKKETNSLEPVYPVNKNVKQHILVQFIRQAFDEYGSFLIDLVPLSIKKQYQLLDIQDAVRKIHFPETLEEYKQARRTLIFEELFLYQLKLQVLRRKERQLNSGLSILYDVEKLKSFIRKLPFELTNAQKRSINELCRDLRKPIQMNRLLQGDVGSGKTVVAASALYAVVTAGMQGALMAPTEILAEQHMKNLEALFSSFDVKIALLTSSVKPKEKREIYDRIFEGDIDIVIGTHALIQEGVDFKQLGLVITDEQHRFGVNQRRKLAEKGIKPDVLAMTATPIPRTLTITAYGEMDVSVLDEMPAGRKPIVTHWVKPSQESSVFQLVKTQLEKKSQVYVVSPLIEESEHMDLKNVTELKEKYETIYGADYQIGLLHGKVSPDEKEEMMNQFKENNIQLLVATTVVEVGVDVPNATLMVIYDADRFGLAQLHQLRGRVGRGEKASHCILIADPKGETGKERMKIMTETNDGFLLSQKDLELRGPGDVFGNKQSGIPDFKLADITVDTTALETARQEAVRLIQSEDFFTDVQYTQLRETVGLTAKLKQPSKEELF